MNDGAHDLVGQTLLGRLKVLRRLGSGGMGTVYEVGSSSGGALAGAISGTCSGKPSERRKARMTRGW